MRVFDFTLLSGYEFSGVDVAQGFRARLFAKNNVNAKFIFTELPTIRDMELYGSQKIKRGQIMSAHLFMTGRLDMSLSVKKEALLENEKENYEYDNIDEDGKVIRLYNSGEKSVEILCDEDGFVINESLFKNGKKYLVNYYTDSLSYTELYNWDNDSNDGLNPERRIFWNKQGQMVYEQCIYKDNVEYLFKNGEVIDNVEFLERFVKALNLCENDICIMDRAGYLDYIQPLFENKGKSKLIAVLHSDHFYKIYEDESSLYMNYEYYYWFKYSEAIDYFVVGTDEHKRSLEAFLKEYDCFVPHIAAIPPGAIPEGKLKSKNNRWRGSIISASRLSPRKGIDILIKSVIKAHEINQTINLDIYGSGNDEYTSYLQNIVKDAGADDYIHFKGRCNLEKIYPHYELFAVYFSGYRTQEGFEGYYMMRGFGCPFILVTDPRSEGGAFYLGDSEFEQMITDYVTDKLDELGLTKDELVLSGASMGTFGSLYYGSKLSPHALLLAKPLANMGNVARNERILRAGGFATSLDILMKNYDNLSDEAIEQLNNRMWDRFDSADWSQTKFIISYLYEDDYDPDGYPSILSHLKSSGVEVYGKVCFHRYVSNRKYRAHDKKYRLFG